MELEVTRNAPKLTYSNLKFQNFPRAEIPGPPLKGELVGDVNTREGEGKRR